MIGQELNGYRILEQIGEGGMATVYRAYDPAMDRDVAIKVLPEFYAKKPHFVDRFRVEAKAVAKLEHPHILPVHGYGEEDGITYLVMRYVPGGTLTDLIRQQGALPLDIVSRILSQVGSALDYAHQRGIIHRDVKPSNILLDDNGNSYLMDFGIAKIVEAAGDLTGTGQMLGTPAYMSPEQFTSPRDLTGASDQYSLGIVAYQMVTGDVPYHAETPWAFLNMHLNEPLPLPSSKVQGLPQGIERAILKSLAKQPDGRFASCSEFAEAFQQVGKEKFVSAPISNSRLDAPTIDERGTELHRNRFRRSRGIWLAVLFMGIASISIFFVLMARNNNVRGTEQIVYITSTPAEVILVDSLTSTIVPTSTLSVSPTVRPTSTSRPTSTATPVLNAGEILFQDTFDNDLSDDWRITDQRWNAVNFNGATVLEVNNSDSDEYTFATITNDSVFQTEYVQLDFSAFISEWVQASWQNVMSVTIKQTDTPGYNYDLTFIFPDSTKLYRNNSGWSAGPQIGRRDDFPIPTEEWFTVRIIVIGNRIQTFLNDQHYTSTDSADDWYRYGYFGFGTPPNTTFYLDSIQITELTP